MDVLVKGAGDIYGLIESEPIEGRIANRNRLIVQCSGLVSWEVDWIMHANVKKTNENNEYEFEERRRFR